MRNKRHRTRRREANRATLGSVAGAPSFQALRKKRNKRSRLRFVLGAAIMVSVASSMLFVGPSAAIAGLGDSPEIDPGSVAGALTLLVGGVLALTDRVRHA